MSLTKNKVIGLVLGIGALLFLIFYQGLYSKDPVSTPNSSENQSIEVVLTNPNPLEGATIIPNQTIEISFNTPFESSSEIKYAIEPKQEFKIELSEDRKTAKFTPIPSFDLGQGFSLQFKSDTKFEGKKTLDKEIIYHFKVIDYKGV